MRAVSAATRHRIALTTAAIAAAFVVTVAGVLLYQRATATTNDPWKSPQLLALKERLRAAPADAAVKEQIRVLDLQFRRDYRQRLRLAGSGGWLILGGALMLVVSLQAAAKTKERLPQPRPDPEAGRRAAHVAARSRTAVAIAGGVGVAAMLVIGLGVRSSLDAGRNAAQPAPIAESLPSAEEFARNWPQFRGPGGSGVAAGPDALLQWDAPGGRGVVWKSPVPAPGFNSPIVWGDRVFISGATADVREVFCFEAATGKLAWRARIDPPPRPAPKTKVSEMAGFAASTMATDGRRVYAIFARGEIGAVRFDGTVAWTKNMSVTENPYGHASSLAVWQGRVIVQFDQEGRGGSRLVALDGATGRVVWEKPREVSSSWASPIVIEAAGRTQIITVAEPCAIAYAFGDGSELWRAEAAHGEVVPSPIFAGGLVMVVHPSAALTAIKPDGSGDVAATHVVWKAEDNVPDVTSPVSNGELVFMVESGGMLACFDAKNGKRVWEHDLKEQVQASPLIVGQRLYVPCAEGLTIVVEVGRQYRELARNPLGEKILASPAVLGGRLYLRGAEHLFCIANPEAKP